MDFRQAIQLRDILTGKVELSVLDVGDSATFFSRNYFL